MIIKDVIHKYMYRLYIVVSIIPLVWLLLFLGLHLYLRYSLNIAPSYNSPQLNDSHWILHYYTIGVFVLGIVTFWCVLYAFPVLLFINLILRYIRFMDMMRLYIYLGLFNVFMVYYVLEINQQLSSTMNWILD